MNTEHGGALTFPVAAGLTVVLSIRDTDGGGAVDEELERERKRKSLAKSPHS